MQTISSTVPGTHEEAVVLANEIERLEAVVKAAKGLLKEFVEQNGPVETSYERWDFIHAESWSFNKGATKDIAKRLASDGVNPWDFLSFAAKDLKRIGWEDQELSQYGQVKTVKRFTSRKL